METVYKIVLTGGPCGGKTTAMAHITDRLRSLGFNVFVVPETATMMILGGISLLGESASAVMQTQTSVLETQLYMEKMFLKQAKLTGKPSVILCDRGAMDGSAFIPPDMWQAMLDENGWSLVGLRDKHYDAIVHLVTAAIGAVEYYTLENNAARSETPEQAAVIDRRIQEAWVGHPHLRVIDNSTDFAAKIKRVTAAICNVVGVPEPVERERKFLVDHFQGFGDFKHEDIDIEQTYLLSDSGVARVRKRGQHGSFTYTHTVKHFLSAGKNVELERMISSREYLTLLESSDPDRNRVIKKRSCFLWENQYFELDTFVDPWFGLCLLEAEIEEDDAEVKLPPFIKVIREVTMEREYSNAELARK